LQETLEEYKEIHQVLVRKNDDNNKDTNCLEDDGITTTSASLAALKRNNELLGNDLKYVTDCIQEDRPGADLYDVLLKLVNLRVDYAEDNPYVKLEDKALLQLLRDELHVIESYQGDEHTVCLVDYLSTHLDES